MKEFNVGDKVYWATYGMKEIEVKCPVCYGNKSIVVILGNGEQVSVKCNFCTRGFSEPYGVIIEYKLLSDIKEITLTGKEVYEDNKGKKLEYRFGSYVLDNTNCFETKKEAEKRVKEMIIERRKEEVERLKYTKNETIKKASWSVGYYKLKIKEAEKEIAKYKDMLIYHEEDSL